MPLIFTLATNSVAHTSQFGDRALTLYWSGIRTNIQIDRESNYRGHSNAVDRRVERANFQAYPLIHLIIIPKKLSETRLRKDIGFSLLEEINIHSYHLKLDYQVQKIVFLVKISLQSII